MQNVIQDLVVSNIFAFILIFVRFGVALMIMPGIGDSFVSPTIRLLFALAISFVLTPVLSTHLPPMPPGSGAFLALIVSEAFIGIFIGSVMRILISALDTAGTLVSMQSSLSNSTLFNPTTAAQVPILSAVYSSLGVTLIFVTDMDHQMLAAVVDSYKLFPPTSGFPDMGSVSETIVKTAVLAFRVGAQLAIPFLVVGTLVQVGFGLLGRLMPQVQVFFLAMPVQIFLSLLIMMMVISASIMYWLNGFETILSQSLILE
jgi:flagellar biosynthetic protein FliR